MIKVDIISGFLGAGKTTIIKRLARALASRGEKIAIIENEFGDEDIDGKLLKIDGLTVYEITNGCLCCTLKEDFITSIIRVADKIKPDRVLIEPSGIFVLSEVFDIFTHEDIRGKLAINSVTTVVDGVNFLAQKHKYGFFFENQLRYAQNAVISKSENLGTDALLNISYELQRINGDLNIVLSDTAHPDDNEDLLGLLDTETQVTQPTGVNKSSRLMVHAHFNFSSLAIKPQRAFTPDELNDLLGKFADIENFGQVLRAKGFLISANAGETLRLSYVNGAVEIKTEDRLPEGGPILSFIGEKLKKKRISALFD